MSRKRCLGWIGAGLALCAAVGGCTQHDVNSADQTFHQVAQGAHNVGKQIANSADQAGHKVNQKIKNEKAEHQNEKAEHHT